ncbi:MAG TPA: hypothetical protein VKU01_21720 [Bryobacteraceae bacterium]|nr:hypothetical protein [Bryobacteraceae bacterium]
MAIMHARCRRNVIPMGLSLKLSRFWLYFSLLAAISGGASAFQGSSQLFDYGRSAALDVREEKQIPVEGARVTSLSYVGARGSVSAFLVTPATPGKHPAIVFAHDLSSKSDEFLAEAIGLARAPLGAVSLLVDAPTARPFGWRRTFNPRLENNDRDIQVQAIVDLRRGIDLLTQRPDVDASHVGFVGHGNGANWGAVLAGIEPRIKAFALVAGMISVSDAMRRDEPDWADLRFVMGKEGFERYLASIAEVDAAKYVEHSLGAPILLQFGRFDPYVPQDLAARFSAAVHGRTITYDAGHAVNDPAAAPDRQRFLTEYLGRQAGSKVSK